MLDDRRTIRPESQTKGRFTNRSLRPQLVHGAMFILPLALVQPVLGQASGSAAPAAGDDSKAIQATGKETFGVQFQDTDILQALQMLSIQGQKNIIAGKGVSGTVTANLFDVTVQEALDVILRANDLRYEEVGNFIYVYTRDDWEAMQQARRKKESRRFTLEYISAKDANEFVQPLISEVGKVSFMGQTERGVQADVSNAGEDSWAFQAMLVVNDYPENLQAIADFLAEVDTPPQQVSVESTIVSTRVNEDNAFGIDFSVIGDIDFADLTNPLAAVNNLIAGNNTPGEKATEELGFQPVDNRAAAGSSTVGRTSQAGGLKVGVISKNVSAFLRVLDEVTDTMVLARPRVMALNRQRSHILVGEKVGYLSTTQTETTATQTVQYLDTGIKLIFRPFISKDGSIRMELAPSVSEATLRQVTTDAGGGVVIPDEKTNEVTTNVRVKDGQTLVLGGLFQEKTTISRRQVPILGDVPILGNAFKGQDDKLERNEIMFLITPTIVHDSLIARTGDEGNAFAEAVRVGAREGLLPFSREKMSSSHNQQAIEALANGDTEKALYHTENSLRINSNQPEMIRLREQLDKKQPARVFERDMYKRIGEKRSELRREQEAELAAAAAAAQPAKRDPLAEPATIIGNGSDRELANATEPTEPTEPTGVDSLDLPTEGFESGETAAPEFADDGANQTFEGESTDEATEGVAEELETDTTALVDPADDPRIGDNGERYPTAYEVIAAVLQAPSVTPESAEFDAACEAYELQAQLDRAAMLAAADAAQQPIIALPLEGATEGLTLPETTAAQWRSRSILSMLDQRFGFPALGFATLIRDGFAPLQGVMANASTRPEWSERNVTRSAVTIQPNAEQVAEVGEPSEEFDPSSSPYGNDPQ
jgi:type IV pilus assembly protein PilQ